MYTLHCQFSIKAKSPFLNNVDVNVSFVSKWSVCFSDVVNLNLKSTLRVLYNLFTNYKNSDWTLTTFTFTSAEATVHLWTTAEDHLGPESLHDLGFKKRKKRPTGPGLINCSEYSEMSTEFIYPFLKC